MPTDKPCHAGSGDYDFHVIPFGAPLGPIQPGQEYLAIDGVRWFVNMRATPFKSKMAAATLDVKLDQELFEFVLGTFETEHGAKTAPFANVELVRPTPYQGGTLTLTSMITAIKQNTQLAKLLQGISSATVTAAAGAVSFGSGSVAATIATSAIKTTVEGVNGLLQAEGTKQVEIFGKSGCTFGVHPEKDCRTKETYVLLRRGSRDLLDDKFSVVVSGGLAELRYAGQELLDGAWMLLRIRREDHFDERPWQDEVNKLLAEIKNIVSSVEMGGTTKADAQKALVPSGGEPGTLGDRILALLHVISTDQTITEPDREKERDEIKKAWEGAREAVK